MDGKWKSVHLGGGQKTAGGEIVAPSSNFQKTASEVPVETPVAKALLMLEPMKLAATSHMYMRSHI